jgi:tyrosine-specific transport protein
MIRNIIYPISVLAGTIIGVGLFSLPYITLQSGFWIVLAYFIVLGILITKVHLCFGEIALKTPDFKRFPGFVKHHLGNNFKKIALFSNIFGFFGASLAYLIVGGEFLKELFSPILEESSEFYTLIYFIPAALLILLGVKAIAKVEFWGLISFFIILILIFLRGMHAITPTNLFTSTNFSHFFLPYGVILFSLWGAALIPEVEEMLHRNKKLLKIVIPISIILPIVVYLFFSYLILGITGANTTESALTGLRLYFGDGVVSLILFLGLLTTFTSLITLGLTLKKIFCYDLKINQLIAWAITCFAPLAIFFLGIKNFIPVIIFIGTFMLGIDGILIMLMYKKIRPAKKIIAYLLSLIFLGGIVYQIIYFFL